LGELLRRTEQQIEEGNLARIEAPEQRKKKRSLSPTSDAKPTALTRGPVLPADHAGQPALGRNALWHMF
jgi:hypothetical protein